MTATMQEETEKAERLQEAHDLIPEIKAAHEACLASLQAGLEHAIRCGEYLTRAKELVPGQWAKWVEKHCDFKIRTATNYMRVYRHRKRVPKEMSYRQAVAALVARKKKAPDTTAAPTARATAAVVTQKALDKVIGEYAHSIGDGKIFLRRDELLAMLAALGVAVK